MSDTSWYLGIREKRANSDLMLRDLIQMGADDREFLPSAEIAQNVGLAGAGIGGAVAAHQAVPNFLNQELANWSNNMSPENFARETDPAYRARVSARTPAGIAGYVPRQIDNHFRAAIQGGGSAQEVAENALRAAGRNKQMMRRGGMAGLAGLGLAGVANQFTE